MGIVVYNEWQKEVSPLAPLLLIDSVIALMATAAAKVVTVVTAVAKAMAVASAAAPATPVAAAANPANTLQKGTIYLLT